MISSFPSSQLIQLFPSSTFLFLVIPSSHFIKPRQNMPQLLEEPKSSSAPKQSMYGSFVQLPPKIPSNWPPTPNHHRHLPGHPSRASFSPPSSATLPSEPSWPDELLSQPNHNLPAHRRAASDSSADSTFPEFDRLRHDNLMYMLSDDERHSSSAAPCTPSDHDSTTDDKPGPLAWSEHDQSEAQSSCNAEQRAASPAAYNTDSQPIVDPKRVKRYCSEDQNNACF
ncbi:hypothetical protein KSP39_PZI019542 [Platanthera zijinensis]|uniref:Uncharacterized protein n=1 Tax=Platanthera zijinensis TaxID=2320716 RepID=A0AAP0FYE3_9ASPA